MCPNCSGDLEVIDEAIGHVICDCCGYERDFTGVINAGETED